MECILDSRYSFEFFPPKSDASKQSFAACLDALSQWQPEFSSMTYGASGSSQKESFSACQGLQQKGHVCAAHITAVNASKQEVNSAARAFAAHGIDHLVALRGDSPQGPFKADANGYAYAKEMVAGFREWFEGTISVAGYPETHPEASSAVADIGHLKTKIDAGADQIMTQYCYDTDTILRFSDQLRSHNVPVIVGVMPIHDIEAIQRFSARCGASVPTELVKQFERFSHKDDQFKLAVDIAVTQIEQLASHGLDRVHLYTLNRHQWVHGILEALEQPKLLKSA